MGGSMSKAMGLYLRSLICSWISGWEVWLLQDVHHQRASRPILETETVFREVLDKEGNIVYGTISSDCEDMYLSQTDKVIASRVTLLRRLLRGQTVDVLVGPERTQFSVPKLLLFHHSKVAERTFVEHGGDKHFREFDENALCLPEHAPETFEFILLWMYQNQLGINEYCQTLFNSHDKQKEGLEAGFLLLCRVYILADYLDIHEIIDAVMSECDRILWTMNDAPDFPIGPDAVRAVFRNIAEGSRLYKFVLEKLADSFVHRSNARPIEEYTECFKEVEGFGTVIMKRVLELHAKSVLKPPVW